MKQIRLLDLGTVSPVRSQTVYHAVAYAMSEDSPDTIILVSPSEPYACIGFHQDLEKEIDLDYCQTHGLPVYRREVGGGAVYLDDGQIFSQWVFREGHLPKNLEAQFKLYAQPLVDTYQALGVEAYLRPINDIHVAGKKIGGTGAALIGQGQVVVGSLMLTFDKLTMTRILKVPSEKMRDKIFESLEQYMTTLEEQLNQLPDRQVLKALYVEKCAEALGVEIVSGEWTAEEEAEAAKLDAQFISPDWLYQKGSLRPASVKIHEDVRVVETAYKAPGGLIRVTARLREGRIDDISLSGDFTLLPAAALTELEQAMRGISIDQETLRVHLNSVYTSHRIQSPGVTPGDFVAAIVQAMEG